VEALSDGSGTARQCLHFPQTTEIYTKEHGTLEIEREQYIEAKGNNYKDAVCSHERDIGLLAWLLSQSG
jgi:hypothetical protein